MAETGLLIQPPQIPRVWAVAYPFLARVDDYHWSEQDILERAQSGRLQLWLCLKDTEVIGACLTQVIEHPQCSVIKVLTMGGDGGDWDAMLRDVEAYGKHRGCSHLEIVGRRGWLRALSGLSELHSTFSRRID